jgi:Flp pilus assembly protein TadB
MMKSDRQKAQMWPKEHRVLAMCVCVCVVILALVATYLGIMTARAAFAASLLAIIYVVLMTHYYTRPSKENRHRDISS